MRPDEAASAQQRDYIALVQKLVVQSKMNLPTARTMARAAIQAQQDAERAALAARDSAVEDAMRPKVDSLAPRKRSKTEKSR